MSADNWGMCPKCRENKTEDKETGGYTLREEYEIGIDYTGEFYIQYEGRCTICGFRKTFQYKEKLPL